MQLPAIQKGQTHITDESRHKLFEAIGFLNSFLEGKQFIIGSEQPTIADLAVFSSIANVVVNFIGDLLINLRNDFLI